MVGGGHKKADVHSTQSSSQVCLARVHRASWREDEHLWRCGKVCQQRLSAMRRKAAKGLTDTGTPALRDGSSEPGLPDSFPMQAAFLGLLADMCSPAAEAWWGLRPDICSFGTPALLALALLKCTPNVRRPGKGRFSDWEVYGVGGNMQTEVPRG